MAFLPGLLAAGVSSGIIPDLIGKAGKWISGLFGGSEPVQAVVSKVGDFVTDVVGNVSRGQKLGEAASNAASHAARQFAGAPPTQSAEAEALQNMHVSNQLPMVIPMQHVVNRMQPKEATFMEESDAYGKPMRGADTRGYMGMNPSFTSSMREPSHAPSGALMSAGGFAPMSSSHGPSHLDPDEIPHPTASGIVEDMGREWIDLVCRDPVKAGDEAWWEWVGDSLRGKAFEVEERTKSQLPKFIAAAKEYAASCAREEAAPPGPRDQYQLEEEYEEERPPPRWYQRAVAPRRAPARKPRRAPEPARRKGTTRRFARDLRK